MKLSKNKEKRIEQITKAVVPLFEKYGIIKASLFGSVIRDDFDADHESDIDLFVEFDPQIQLTFFKLGSIYENISDQIGRKVDLLRPHLIKPGLEKYIIPTLKPIYEKG